MNMTWKIPVNPSVNAHRAPDPEPVEEPLPEPRPIPEEDLVPPDHNPSVGFVVPANAGTRRSLRRHGFYIGVTAIMATQSLLHDSYFTI